MSNELSFESMLLSEGWGSAVELIAVNVFCFWV